MIPSGYHIPSLPVWLTCQTGHLWRARAVIRPMSVTHHHPDRCPLCHHPGTPIPRAAA